LYHNPQQKSIYIIIFFLKILPEIFKIFCRFLQFVRRSKIFRKAKKDPKKSAEKFEKKPFEPRPAIATLWLEIPEEKQTDMEAAIRELPESFTEKQLRDCLKEKGLCECVSKPSQSVNATLQCDHFFWELDENFDCIYRNPRLT
jgi:hypothetical protein